AALFLRPSAPSGPDPGEETRRRAEQQKLAADRKAGEEKFRIEREKLDAEKVAIETRAKAVDSDLKSMNVRLLKAVSMSNPGLLRPGLVGEYFAGLNFDMLGLRRIDPDIRFGVKS